MFHIKHELYDVSLHCIIVEKPRWFPYPEGLWQNDRHYAVNIFKSIVLNEKMKRCRYMAPQGHNELRLGGGLLAFQLHDMGGWIDSYVEVSVVVR